MMISDPASEVETSRTCQCCGYSSCGMCLSECIGAYVLCKVCCNCSNCLYCMCMCCEKIGCKSLVACCGCNADLLCDAESPLCLILAHGLLVMIAAAACFCYSISLALQYGDLYDAALLLESKYSCGLSPEQINYATEQKHVMYLQYVIYLLMASGSLLSCASGPIFILRWFSIPFHLLVGVFVHIYGIWELQAVRYSIAGNACADMANPVGPIVTNPATADARLIDKNFQMQAWGIIVFTVLNSLGCIQEQFWNRATQRAVAKGRVLSVEQQKANKKTALEVSDFQA